MTTAIRELALQGFLARLATLAPTIPVDRNKDDAIPAAKLPSIVMVDGGQDRHTGSGGDGEVFGQDTYTLRVRVFGYVTAADDAALGSAISDLYAKIVRAVLADPYLGGAAQYTREAANSLEDPEWDHDDGKRPNAAFVVNFEIEFVTRQGDPFTTA